MPDASHLGLAAPAGSTECSRQRGRGGWRERECKHACVVWGSSGGPQKREVLASCDVAVARVRRIDGAGADGDCLEVAVTRRTEMATAAATATATGETLAASRMTHLLD